MNVNKINEINEATLPVSKHPIIDRLTINWQSGFTG